MNHRIRKTAALLPAACGLLLAAHGASAHEIYAKAGFPGVGAGYAHSLNEYFGVQADFTTAGTINRDGVAGQLRYEADLKADQLGVYGNWFPFGGSFRLSGGLHSRTLEVSAQGRAQNGTITIGDVTIPYDGGDTNLVQARVEWPKVAPYLGIGWGHHARHGQGFGFIADVGVSFGSPKTELTISQPLLDKLGEIAKMDPRINPDAEIDRQRRAMAKDVETVKVFPHLFVGVSYQF